MRAFNVMTGCDSVASFYGIGKKQVWKRTATSVESQTLLSDESLVKFTIRYIYNKRSNTLAEMREAKWREMRKKSLAKTGIGADTFALRSKWVRHQIHVFECFSDKTTTNCPLLNGGYTRNGEHCIPIRYSLPSLPTSLSNITTPPVDKSCNVDAA